MAANVYECMFLLNASKMAGDQPGVVGQLHTILERNQAEVLASRTWDGDRKLAYPIENQKKGHYYITYFRTDGKNLANIERDIQLNETILRHLILKIDPKLEATMLEIGRTERAMCFHAAAEGADDDLTGDDRGDRRGGGGPRRGPEPRAPEPKDKDE
jgi:small subunit ribosomal protein S6